MCTGLSNVIAPSGVVNYVHTTRIEQEKIFLEKGYLIELGIARWMVG
jgi:hypothetical protein